jgi:hypothetical protein
MAPPAIAGDELDCETDVAREVPEVTAAEVMVANVDALLVGCNEGGL